MPASKLPTPAGLIRKEGKDGKMYCCTVENCGVSFKKLEHAQRHERTHTHVRPYICSVCTKTFARQDTLNRHTRLHTRKEEDGPTAKAGRKKKGVSASPATQPIELKPVSLPPPTAAAPAMAAPASPPRTTPTTSTSLPFNFGIPIMPPSFPAYSRPYLGDGVGSLPLDHTFLPMPMPVRRFSDVSYGTTMPMLHQPTMNRPRANTLAGLPEALGSFSLVNSPQSSGAVDSDSEDGDDDDDKGLSPPEKDQPESQYPSPAFTSYSPSDLQRDTLSDLEAILANDPLHSNNSTLFNPAAQSHPEDGFDFESFAAAVEGPQPGSTLEDLLAAASPPTPPSAHPAPSLLPHQQPQTHLDFDFSATFAAADRQRREREQQKEREQAVAQAAAAANSNSLPSFNIPSFHGHNHPPLQHHHQQSPHLSFPISSSAPSYPTAAYASAFSNSFPSLMALPNGLGLSQNAEPAHQALLEAYRKRSAAAGNAGSSSSVSVTVGTSPAFYIPSSSGESVSPPAIAAAPSMTPAARFSLPVPVWSSAARDGAERGETGALFVV